MRYLIGLDIGTSGAKCIIADEMGRVAASATVEYPLYTPQPGWAEQNPADWWTAVRQGTQKILWLRDEEPENFERMDVFICPKDYIRFQLTGEIAIDASDASGTGFFNTKERRWSDELIAIAGLDKAIFPICLESTDLAGYVTYEAAALTGLPEGLPVYAGGGDAVIQTTGILRVESETLPNPASQSAYRDAFERYASLYPALKPVFDR